MLIANNTRALDVVGVRQTLISNGYRPVPVVGKSPKIRGWQRSRIKADQVAGQARTYPDHTNTGILCGDIIAIDVDVPDEAAAEKMRHLADCLLGASAALRRVGRAPKLMLVFRAEKSRTKRSTGRYSINGHTCQVEQLGTGQQFVAFGVHPDTGREYEWIGKSPLDVTFNDLPSIADEAIDRFLSEADALLASLGTAEIAAAPASTTARSDTFWKAVNSAALHAADMWVAKLFPSAKKEAGTGAWRVTSRDLGRSLEEDISVHQSGIRDFGKEKPATAIGLVQEFGGAPDAKAAAFWLCDAIGRNPSDFGWKDSYKLGVNFKSSALAVVADNDDEDDDTLQTRPQARGTEPIAITYPPGAVGDFARFIESCARFPSKELSLVASLAFVAGLVGRRYKGPTGLRTNIYVVGLADSGFGKDITIRATEALADSTLEGGRVSELLFADKIRSLPGLAKRLARSPSAVCVIDEFGKFLGLHTARNAAAHREEIAAALLELTGAPRGSWGGQEKAQGNIPRIQAPCLTIHGVSTPSTFWEALSSGSIDEGLLARLVVIDAGRGAPKKVRRPHGDIENIPELLSEAVNKLLGGGGRYGGGSFYALNADGASKPWPIVAVHFDDGVEDFFEGFDDRMRSMRSSVDPQYHSILNRVGENAARLALIVAVGCDPKSPVISREIQSWANGIAEASFWTIVKGADDNIADNDRSREYIKVRKIIDAAGADGITQRLLDRKLRGSIDERRLTDIIATLRRSREISLAEARSDTGQRRRRYWIRDHVPENAEVIND